jgi:hypothetical protein
VVITAKDLTETDRLRLNGEVNRILQKGTYTRDDLLREVGQQLAESLKTKRHGNDLTD